jgi:class I fructose-bisphosphate aldolase
MNERISQIMSSYAGENAGVLSNLYRLLNHGTLAGTGKMVILPVDQGFEHGPARSFAPNPAGYDPDYHISLAIESGCNAYAAPLGFLQAVAAKYHGQIPLILKLNNSDSISKVEPCSAVTGSVQDALELGASAIGFTIYPGSGERNTMLEELRELIAEARSVGLPTVVWAYVRGAAVAKEHEQALDLTAYGAQIAAQMGAHVIKVKPPKNVIAGAEAKVAFEKYKIPTETLADRVRHVVQSAFNGKRLVIFSGGEAKGTDDVLAEVKQIAQGGGSGSIMGRNAFQRPRAEAVKLLKDVMGAFHS